MKRDVLKYSVLSNTYSKCSIIFIHCWCMTILIFWYIWWHFISCCNWIWWWWPAYGDIICCVVVVCSSPFIHCCSMFRAFSLLLFIVDGTLLPCSVVILDIVISVVVLRYDDVMHYIGILTDVLVCYIARYLFWHLFVVYVSIHCSLFTDIVLIVHWCHCSSIILFSVCWYSVFWAMIRWCIDWYDMYLFCLYSVIDDSILFIILMTCLILFIHYSVR